jgi:AraC-like DNA-binding protein
LFPQYYLQMATKWNMALRDKLGIICDMATKDFHEIRSQTLWHVDGYGRTVMPAKSRYWFENLSRSPAGSIIFQLNLVGRILYKDPQGEVETGPGDALLFAYGESSCYGRPEPLTKPYVCEYVQFLGAGLAEHWNVLRRRHGSVLHLSVDTPLRQEMQRLWAPANRRTKLTDAERAAAVQTFIMRLFSLLDTQWAEARTPVERAVEDLLRNPTFQRGLKQVAQQHGCSREHLVRVFRDKMGCTPSTYIFKARLNRALELLRETHLPPTQVAEQSGFGTPHTLTRHLRAATGLPPIRWREKFARHSS